MEKPADLFLGVIDFLGILVPGAVFTFLHGMTILEIAGIEPTAAPEVPVWAVLVVSSYVLGHFLLGLTVPLNGLAQRLSWLDLDSSKFYDAVRPKIPLPKTVEATRTDAYYAAFSYLRLYAPNALAEVERQTAEYKLFRCLTLVALLDIPMSLLGGQWSAARIVLAIALTVAAAYRFAFLLNWTYRLTFEFYALALRGPAHAA